MAGKTAAERKGWKLVRPRYQGRNAYFRCRKCGKRVGSYFNDVGIWQFCPHCGDRKEPKE